MTDSTQSSPAADAAAGAALRIRDRAQVDAEATELGRALGVPGLAVGLMRSRGVEGLDAQRRWLSPRLAELRTPLGETGAMAGFEAALETLAQAHARGGKIGVFGDYDVDGVSTACVLANLLETLGFVVVPRVAHRDEGYGFTMAAAQAFVGAGVDVLLTGDCGTSDHESLAYLQERGVETVVIDHHQVPETDPPATAFINPWQRACSFPFKGLCSAGVAFYLGAALRSRLASKSGGSRSGTDPRDLLDLVALATVCDMMPLVEENRILVRAGLDRLQRRERPGLGALMECAKIDPDTALDEGHLGFTLGPRLNAPGRLGSAMPSLELLRARSEAEAVGLAARVEAENSRRRTLSGQLEVQVEAALAADPRAPTRAGLVVAGTGWPAGVVGITAAGIAERWRRPVVILAIDDEDGALRDPLVRGSARSYGELDVRAALTACAPLLERHGGHRAAGGVTLRRSQVPAFVEAFDEAVTALGGRVDAARDLCVLHDGEIDPAGLDSGFVEMLRGVGPFGVGFVPPRFLLQGIRVERARVLAEHHQSFEFRVGRGHFMEAIAFGKGHLGLKRGDVIHFTHLPGLRTFRGRTRLQLVVDQLWLG